MEESKCNQFTRYFTKSREYGDKNSNSNSYSCKEEEVEAQISKNTSVYPRRELNVLYFIDINNLAHDNYDQYNKYNNNHEISIKRSFLILFIQSFCFCKRT